jgi:hypothetical protein
VEALIVALVGGLVALAIVLLRRKAGRDKADTPRRAPGAGEKACRFCGEPIKEDARVCPACHRDVSLQTMT